jgi:hypothetical protein
VNIWRGVKRPIGNFPPGWPSRGSIDRSPANSRLRHGHKRLRFGDLVRNSGRPEVVTLWTKPEKNRALTDAVKKNRVLTVTQEPGKRDRGMIGFQLKPGALFLVFPRPLPREQNARVVGINYQLVEQPVALKTLRAKVVKTSSKA